MDPGTMVLLHSPLVGVESWGTLAAALGRAGAETAAPAVGGDEQAPFAERYVRGAVDGVLGAARPAAAAFRVELERGGRFPEWDDADLAPLVPDPEARAALIGSLRPPGLAFFTEPLPAARWPDAPCGYLRLSGAYDRWAEEAAAQGWPVAALDAGHFHPLVDPDGVAVALLGVLARM